MARASRVYAVGRFSKHKGKVGRSELGAGCFGLGQNEPGRDAVDYDAVSYGVDE